MAAVQKFLVDLLVAHAAIACCKVSRNNEAVVLFLLLILSGLVTIEAVHAFLGMLAHFIFVHHRVLLPNVALGTFAGGANELCGRLFSLNLGSSAIDEKCTKNKSKGYYDGDEHRSKGHASSRGPS